MVGEGRERDVGGDGRRYDMAGEARGHDRGGDYMRRGDDMGGQGMW